MRRAKRFWWGYTKSMIARYPDEVNEDERRAVECAIEVTRALSNGDIRLKVIELVYFKKTHTLPGAAMYVHYSYDRIKQWHTQFIWGVAANFSCKKLY